MAAARDPSASATVPPTAAAEADAAGPGGPAPAQHVSRFLLVCPLRNEAFRLPEFNSISAMVGATLEFEGEPEPTSPHWVVRGTAADVRAVVSRSVCIRYGIELWGEGPTWDACHARVQGLPAEVTGWALDSTTPFKFTFESFGRKQIPQERRGLLIDKARYLDLKGGVNMKAAERVFYFLEEYAASSDLEPRRVLFGPLIAESSRSDIALYNLKKRRLIGNTSMDPELSFIMANMGHAGKGALVLDPFVGTGSLLYAAAHFGSFVTGTDINKALLHGLGKTSRAKVEVKQRGPDENIAATMAQYGLTDRFLGVGLVDQSQHCWRLDPGPVFDAIITDPPYGIREGARKVTGKSAPGGTKATKKDGKGGQPPKEPKAGSADATDSGPDAPSDAEPNGKGKAGQPLETRPGGGKGGKGGGGGGGGGATGYWAQTTSEGYVADDVFGDLLDFAARALREGGRLVYWLPVIQEDYTDDQVPVHPCLTLVANTEQSLSGRLARRLITMEKTAAWDRSVGVSSSQAPALNNDFRTKIFTPRDRPAVVLGPGAERLDELPGFQLDSIANAEAVWAGVTAWMEGAEGQAALKQLRVGVQQARFGPAAAVPDGASPPADAGTARDVSFPIPPALLAAVGFASTPPPPGLCCVVSVYRSAQEIKFRSGIEGLAATEATLATFGGTRTLRFRSRSGGQIQRYQVDLEHGTRIAVKPPLLDGEWDHSIAAGAAPLVLVAVGVE